MISSFKDPVHLVAELLISKHASSILLILGIFKLALDLCHSLAQLVQIVVEISFNVGSLELSLTHVLFHFGDIREFLVQSRNFIVYFLLHEALIDAIKLDVITWAFLVELLRKHLINI